jgi:hypothetical protein
MRAERASKIPEPIRRVQKSAAGLRARFDMVPGGLFWRFLVRVLP